MWIRDAFVAVLFVSSCAFSAAERAADLDGVSPSVRELTLPHSAGAGNVAPGETRDTAEAGAHLRGVATGATGAVDKDKAENGVSVASPASHSPEGETGNEVAQPNAVGAPLSASALFSVRGSKFLTLGIVLLIVGLLLTTAGSNPNARTQPSSTEENVQKAMQLMDKMGIKSASNLAIGYICAGVVEIWRALRENQNSQPGQAAQPAVRGRLLLFLGLVAFLASLSSAGVDFAALNVGALLRALLEYISKAHTGLFAAGGTTFIKSLYEVAQHQGSLQLQGGTTVDKETAEAPDTDKQPASGGTVGEPAADTQAGALQQPPKEDGTAPHTETGDEGAASGHHEDKDHARQGAEPDRRPASEEDENPASLPKANGVTASNEDIPAPPKPREDEREDPDSQTGGPEAR
ncbi:hypothetical protein, conserved [Eimeria acervulina]|uniref:Transmembrane protein n=1 Tax=Eimeria acervulina TaxID=5801 RepID=U6GK10_EIMAC|nr:hypothetical protein, conserved [Eimeria acervulina]CDI79613.1 hypothetical protein, conserved [Eimeria acervulina]